MAFSCSTDRFRTGMLSILALVVVGGAGCLRVAAPAAEVPETQGPAIVSPVPFSTVEGAWLRVEGSAAVGEIVTVALTDYNGLTLTERTFAIGAAGDGVGTFLTFLYVPVPTTDLGWIEVRDDAGRKDRIQIAFGKRFEEVTLYFTNDRLDPAVTCEKVFPVRRRIFPANWMEAGAKDAAVEELLRGPSYAEERDGYASALPRHVETRSGVGLRDGVAEVAFSAELDADVAGACRVGLIRRQIEETVKAATGADEVVIGVEGKDPAEVLQP